MLISDGLTAIVEGIAPPPPPSDPNQVEYVFWAGIEATEMTIEFKYPVQLKDAGTRPFADDLIQFGDNNSNVYHLTNPSIDPEIPFPHLFGSLDGEPGPQDILSYCEYGDESGQTNFVQSVDPIAHPFTHHQSLEVVV